MAHSDDIAIVDDAAFRANDDELTSLLRDVYVTEGFTDANVAATIFTPERVRARGRLLCARHNAQSLVGVVILVGPNSETRRLAAPDEGELHLLAVHADWRGRGIGRALIQAAIALAEQAYHRALVLWTQPSMQAAQRLYEQAGFVRAPSDDFAHGERHYLVYRRRLSPR